MTQVAPALAPDAPDPARSDRCRLARELIAFFGLAFAISWGTATFYFLDPPGYRALVGGADISHSWLYYAAVFAPTLSATVLTVAFRGWDGLKPLFARLIRPSSLIWVAAAVVIQPLAMLLFGAVERALNHRGWVDLHALTVGIPTMLLGAPMLLFLDEGAFGEEMGWRGFALPRLLQLMPPATAGALLGAIWSTWHLPAFFVSGMTQSHFAFPFFFVGDVGFSVFMTWLYLRANGNVLVCGVIPHRVGNLLQYAFGYHIVVAGVVTGGLGALLTAILGPSLSGWGKNATIPQSDRTALFTPSRRRKP